MKQTIYFEKPEPCSSHTVIRDWLKPFPAGTRILDVGSATGIIGRMVQGAGLAMYGLEPNPEWAAAARPFYVEVKTGTLEGVERDYLTNFQVVVCGDVLEHMPDPQTALTNLVRLQPSGAVFIISVPNVANIWIRINLFLGRFNYTERGILDRTHLRFFTRRTLIDLVTQAGLNIHKIVPTIIPFNLEHPEIENTRSSHSMYAWVCRITRFFPTLLGYQFVIYAKKP